jgi:hypothetical protein
MVALTPALFFGLDLGQRRDPSAIAVVERLALPHGPLDPVTWERHYRWLFSLRHVERIALGTPYLTIVSRVWDFVTNCPSSSILTPYRTLVVDASGLGAPVVESFRLEQRTADLVPITITGSGVSRADSISGGCLVSRRDLLTALRLLLEANALHIADTIHDRAALIEQLTQVRERSGSAPDDLAIAVALAVWQARRGLPPTPDNSS